MGIDPSHMDLQHLANDHSTTTGIDPSHIDLQHLANDHSTTRATGESSYFSIVANLFLLVYN